MMVSMEVYLRRGQREIQRWFLNPAVRKGGMICLCAVSGFLLSAASLMDFPQPVVVGVLVAASQWQGLVMALGAMVGYPVFWGLPGSQGVVWTAAAGLLTVLLGKDENKKEQPLMLPVLGAFLTGVTALVFQAMLKDRTPLPICLIQVAIALGVGLLFTQAARGRDAFTDWMVGGVGVFTLAQAAPVPWLNLGYISGGLLGASDAFPAAALAGLGLDLAQVTKVPMTAVLSLGYFLRLVPFRYRWQRHLAPGLSYIGVMIVCGIRDPTPIPGLVLGGMAGLLLPPKPELRSRRGETGQAQVRLEMGAEMMNATQRIVAGMELPPIDEFALLEKVRDRACASCSARRSCTQKDQLVRTYLQSPLEADCRKPGRLIPELHRAQEQLRYLKAERQRQAEYRGALQQQYRFLAEYLRSLADRLPRRHEDVVPEFRMEVSARTRGKEGANGDKCLAFSGMGCCYYVLLCDGMGTGLGAAQEGSDAVRYLRQMLLSGFPPEHSLRSYNSLLALRGSAGAVTMDLAEVRLDTGLVTLYKWGAAPSWILTRRGAEKIGTATPPPGIAVEGIRESAEKLSLRRGEVLVLLSDGVDGEDALSHPYLTPDQPPGELAAKILEIGGGSEDDATAAVIRLRPTNPCPA